MLYSCVCCADKLSLYLRHVANYIFLGLMYIHVIIVNHVDRYMENYISSSVWAHGYYKGGSNGYEWSCIWRLETCKILVYPNSVCTFKRTLTIVHTMCAHASNECHAYRKHTYMYTQYTFYLCMIVNILL